MDAATITAVIDSTWPAARFLQRSGWMIRDGAGGGSRVSAATALVPGEIGDIPAAEAAMEELGQVPKFMVRPGETALGAALAARGYREQDPTSLYLIGCDALARPDRESVVPGWPPLAVQREIWAAGGIGPARLAVMERARAPRTSLLGRLDNRVAGTAYVGIHGDTAMLHALEVAMPFRRRGLARQMVAGAAHWAELNGAVRLSLLVTRANVAANRLYASMGFELLEGYRYLVRPEPA